MCRTQKAAIAVVGIEIGKNSFHIVGHDERGGIVLGQEWSRGQVEARFANMPPCLVGMEACVGAHHLSRKLNSLGHNARLMPAKYVRPYSRGQKNDFRDAEAFTHGTDAASIARTIATGVTSRPPGTGAPDRAHDHRLVMPRFDHLSESERRSLALYVMSLRSQTKKGTPQP